jgi:activator of HSP90 ATPase
MLTISRRQFAAASGLAVTAGRALAQGNLAGPISPARAIHQEQDFNTTPKRLYEALLDEKQFQAFSGMPAEINREVGGAFKVFDGVIVGRNVELVVDRRVVQAWRVAAWPEGVYSLARFELQPQAKTTRIVFDHTGFPSNLAESLADGWHEHYWSRLRKYLG